MNVKMIDGTVLPMSEFDVQCDARDDAGRHFSGYADVQVDLLNDESVCPEFRKLWHSNAVYDGDWGADLSTCEWVEAVEPTVYYTFKVPVGDRWNDGHGRYEEELVKATVHPGVIQIALAKAVLEFPELERVCTRYDESVVSEDLMEDLRAKGLVTDNNVKITYLQENTDFIKFFLDIANLYMDTPFTYEFVDDEVPELELPSSGYGLFS